MATKIGTQDKKKANTRPGKIRKKAVESEIAETHHVPDTKLLSSETCSASSHIDNLSEVLKIDSAMVKNDSTLKENFNSEIKPVVCNTNVNDVKENVSTLNSGGSEVHELVMQPKDASAVFENSFIENPKSYAQNASIIDMMSAADLETDLMKSIRIKCRSCEKEQRKEDIIVCRRCSVDHPYCSKWCYDDDHVCIKSNITICEDHQMVDAVEPNIVLPKEQEIDFLVAAGNSAKLPYMLSDDKTNNSVEEISIETGQVKQIKGEVDDAADRDVTDSGVDNAGVIDYGDDVAAGAVADAYITADGAADDSVTADNAADDCDIDDGTTDNVIDGGVVDAGDTDVVTKGGVAEDGINDYGDNIIDGAITNGGVVPGAVGKDDFTDGSESIEKENADSPRQQVEGGIVKNEVLNFYACEITKNSNNPEVVKEILQTFSNTVSEATLVQHKATRNILGERNGSNPKRQRIETEHCVGSSTPADGIFDDDTTSKRNRKKKCPVCSEYRSQLPSHMRTIHHWSEDRARAVNAYNKYVNVDRKLTKGGKIDYHIPKKCPYDGCMVVRKRLGPHLESKHEQICGSEDYKTLLKLAKPWQGLMAKKTMFERQHMARTEEIMKTCNQNITPNFGNPGESQRKRYLPPSREGNRTVFYGTDSRTTDTSLESPASSNEMLTTKQLYARLVQYLISIDGGNLEEDTAKQYSQMIPTTLAKIESDNFTDIFDHCKMRDVFLGVHCKSYAPLTIKKYLKAFMHLCDFVLNDEIHLPSHTTHDVLRMKGKFCGWIRSLSDDVKSREIWRNEEELEALIDSEQVKKYESGEDMRTAITLLGRFSSPNNGLNVTQKIYCCIRDYLLVQIEIQNSHRSGVNRNLLLEEFQDAAPEFVKGKKMMRIKVKKHKTTSTSGSAKIFLTPTIYNHLKIFVENVRSQIPGGCPNIFVTYSGRQMSSGEISKQINATWQRSDVYGDAPKPKRNITCTMFRKSVSTHVLEKLPEASAPVADLLAHSQKTQQKYYNVRKRELSSALGAYHVGNLLRGNTGEDQPLNPSIMDTSPSRKKWSNEEITEIQTLFSEQIREESITLQQIDDMEEYFVFLSAISKKRIYDKVRSLYRYKKQNIAPPKDVQEPNQKVLDFLEGPGRESNCHSATISENHEDENDPSYIESDAISTVIEGKEKIFCEADALQLCGLVGRMLFCGPIAKSQVQLQLNKSSEGTEFLRRFSINTIINRLKYERRKQRKQRSKSSAL